jgi:hypothetical protein
MVRIETTSIVVIFGSRVAPIVVTDDVVGFRPRVGSPIVGVDRVQDFSWRNGAIHLADFDNTSWRMHDSVGEWSMVRVANGCASEEGKWSFDCWILPICRAR